MVIVADPVKAMLIKIWGYIPTILGTILILVVGWFLAKLIETIVARVLKIVKLDQASEKSGIAAMLAQGEIKATLSELIGGLIYWVVISIRSQLTIVHPDNPIDYWSVLACYFVNDYVAYF
jgi:hypothetical protein